ncbi:MAG: flippase-like domain-containing protein, partial [Acidobacteriaceae bacterium]|nr:flippase-like domain-containing protein [Acidobacteriaceae bacterium]
MFSTQPKPRVPFRVLATLVGIALFFFLVRRADPASLLKNIEKLGWGLTLVIALAGVSHVVKTWAWRLTLVGEKGKVSFPRLIALRLAAEAGAQFGMIGQVFGDSMRVSLLSQQIPTACAISSVTLDRGLFFVTGALTS